MLTSRKMSPFENSAILVSIFEGAHRNRGKAEGAQDAHIGDLEHLPAPLENGGMNASGLHLKTTWLRALPSGEVSSPDQVQMAPSSGMFMTVPQALQWTASGSWRCSPHAGQE